VSLEIREALGKHISIKQAASRGKESERKREREREREKERERRVQACKYNATALTVYPRQQAATRVFRLTCNAV